MSHLPHPAFNLLDEPWIPVRTLTGEHSEVSLKEALLGADKYAELAETSPPNLVALYRILLAVLHRALTTHHGPWTTRDRVKWFDEGLPSAPIEAYLDEWRERFWLFHPEHPFMQVPALATAEETKDKTKPWTQISLASACGNTPLLFDHSHDEAPQSISASRALRHLLGYLQFAPSGTVRVFKHSDNNGPLASSLAVLPMAGLLVKTLVLALHPRSPGEVIDLPTWEKAPPVADVLRAARPTLSTGPNDTYTRLSRAALLLQTASASQVQTIRFGAGLTLEKEVNQPDPMVSFRISEGEAKPVVLKGGRAMWRDLPSWLPDPGGSHASPAAVLNWAANLYAALDRGDNTSSILVAGVAPVKANEPAKLLRWRAERLKVPARLLANRDSADELRTRMARAEDVFNGLWATFVNLIAATMPEPKRKETRVRAKSLVNAGPLTSTYFGAMEKALPQMMWQIAAGDIDNALLGWSGAIDGAARQAWSTARKTLGESAAAIRAEARAYPKLTRLLRALNDSPTTTAAEETSP